MRFLMRNCLNMYSTAKMEFLRKRFGQQRYPIQLCGSPQILWIHFNVDIMKLSITVLDHAMKSTLTTYVQLLSINKIKYFNIVLGLLCYKLITIVNCYLETGLTCIVY